MYTQWSLSGDSNMEINLNWKKEYEIGIYEIDAEHQVFLKIINKLSDAFNENLKKDNVKLYIMELYKYTDFHFTSEENIMIKYDYPDYQRHKNEHEKLLMKLKELIVSYQNDFLDKEELLSFLIHWFKEHTTKIDKKMGNYLQGKK